MIPMNKVQPFMPSQDIIDYVAQITGGKAIHAFSLVKYQLALEKTMQYVFGDAFICEDNETAKRVAFDPRVRMRCVTLEGDVYNPQGVLSGGSTPDNGTELLKKVKELFRLEEELRYVDHKL